MSQTEPEEWDDQEPLAADDPSLKYDDGYTPPVVHGIHATEPVVKDGQLVCTVCGGVLLVLSPEILEHNTDR